MSFPHRALNKMMRAKQGGVATGPSSTKRWWPKLILVSGLALTGISFISAQQPDDDDPYLNYTSSAGLKDPITKLQADIDSGKVKLKYDPEKGYLVSMMEALNINPDTQTLVWSKTSSQLDNTSPKQPRALYYNDTAYIGWAQHDGLLDLVGMDPIKGPIFFTLEQKESAKPRFQRDVSCMNCHASNKTMNLPGLVIRSVFATSEGRARQQLPTFIAGHNNPLKERWGGWYVTGKHGDDTHMGNAFLYGQDPHKPLDLTANSNITDLSDRFDTSKYLVPTSDTVALMVLDDSVRMESMILRAQVAALHVMNDPLYNKKPEADKQRIISTAAEPLLAYLLFRDEAPLQGPITGTNDFAKRFETLGPFDSKGRSLRKFDLQKRLFKYPCNYHIYTPGFDGLPDVMKTYLYRRMDEILTGKDQSRLYKDMDPTDRKNVLEILLDTKPDFKAWMVTNDPTHA